MAYQQAWWCLMFWWIILYCDGMKGSLLSYITRRYLILPNQPMKLVFHMLSHWILYRKCLSSRWHQVHRWTRNSHREWRILRPLFWEGVVRVDSWVRCGGGPFHWCTFLHKIYGGCWIWTIFLAQTWRWVGSCFEWRGGRNLSPWWQLPRETACFLIFSWECWTYRYY